MVQIVWDKSLPVYDVQVSIKDQIEGGANSFYMWLDRATAHPGYGERVAAVDPDGWRVEAEVIEVASIASKPDLVRLLLRPVAAHGDYRPTAIRGRYVDGEWESRE